MSSAMLANLHKGHNPGATVHQLEESHLPHHSTNDTAVNGDVYVVADYRSTGQALNLVAGSAADGDKRGYGSSISSRSRNFCRISALPFSTPV